MLCPTLMMVTMMVLLLMLMGRLMDGVHEDSDGSDVDAEDGRC